MLWAQLCLLCSALWPLAGRTHVGSTSMTLWVPRFRAHRPLLALTHMCLLQSLAGSKPLPPFVYQEHLSTKTTYESRRGFANFDTQATPHRTQTVFTYWLTRHGTRWPTKKRMNQIDRLQNVFQSAGHNAKQLYPWIAGWTSPFKSQEHLAGLLHSKGRVEMRDMGVEFRQHYSQSSIQHILSSVHVLATAKGRTQDSAKAFMEGLCGGTHTYTDQAGAAGITGHDRHVAITGPGVQGKYTIHAKPKDQDPVLRFFDMCPAYDAYVTQINNDILDRWALQQWASLIPTLAHRLQLEEGSLTGQQVDALWHLCQQEAGLWGVTHRACALFPPQACSLLLFLRT
ncbi:hypothetical protein ABBQ32_010242 [Trebouxia sp. C0010 RCD-2024]